MGACYLHFIIRKGAHAFEKISDANETSQRAWSFEETLPYRYKVTISAVGLIVQVPANAGSLLLKTFDAIPYAKKTNYYTKLANMTLKTNHKFGSERVRPKR